MGVLSKDNNDSILVALQSQSEGSNSLYLEYLIIYHFITQVVLNPHSSVSVPQNAGILYMCVAMLNLAFLFFYSYVVIFFYMFSKENIISSPALGQL